MLNKIGCVIPFLFISRVTIWWLTVEPKSSGYGNTVANFILRIPFLLNNKKEVCNTIYTIYKITNLINNKSYIGITKRNPRIRYNEHFCNKNELLYKAKNKYGKENFSLEIIEENVPKDKVDRKEREYIILYNSLVPNGYNLSLGGISNKGISVSGRQKLKECNLGIKNPKCKKYILMIDPNSKEVIRKFGSTREAGRFLGSENKYRAIALSLSKNNEQISHGYIWKYEE